MVRQRISVAGTFCPDAYKIPVLVHASLRVHIGLAPNRKAQPMTASPLTLLFQRLADAPCALPSHICLRASISSSGDGLFLLSSHDYDHGPGHTLKLCIVNAETSRTIDIPDLDVFFSLADLFPDGKVLLVSSGDAPGDHRSFEGNSVIFDPATGHTTHFVLGVGI